MNRIICAPEVCIPSNLDSEAVYFCEYNRPAIRKNTIGYFGTTLQTKIRRRGLFPSIPAWDFLTIALSIA